MASEHIDRAAAELARSREKRGRDERTRFDPSTAGPMVSDEDQFRLLIAAVADYAIITLDASGRVTSWNDGARRIKGYEASEVLGRHFALFYPLEDIERGKAQAELSAARESGYFEEEGWRVRKGGERFWAHVSLTVLRDESSAVRGFAKITRDLTERERARAAVAQLTIVEGQLQAAETARDEAEQAERCLLGIVGAMSDGYFTLDEQWRFTFVNPSLARLLGTPGRDLVGASFWDEVTDSIHSKFFRYLPELLTAQRLVEFTELHAPTRRWFSVRAERTDGGIGVLLRDVTAEQGQRSG
ncbi:MAG TPA: PAS domain S-box protein [Gemmatimonadaceae bacterium]|nr:PAS domain S-box protein [Gemmatimonadaceae bacterium]